MSDLDVMAKKKNIAFAGNQIPVIQPVASHHTNQLNSCAVY
jgi:hypothetical protein